MPDLTQQLFYLHLTSCSHSVITNHPTTEMDSRYEAIYCEMSLHLFFFLSSVLSFKYSLPCIYSQTVTFKSGERGKIHSLVTRTTGKSEYLYLS